MIAIGSDHGGFALKEEVKLYLDQLEVPYKDFGTHTETSCDYPVIAEAACRSIQSGECEKALLFCGTGIGISIAANKMKGIRAACCSDTFSARFTRLHNDANVLCMGGRVVGAGLACELVDAFLNSEYLGERHARRVAMITELENKEL
ncbi:ribose 5-phosphate isomerase B [Oscillospiraceae bacterium MB08-C2-2]|nr:ribose 5-phosphate isomerase B [Oscillospiraceae bacterium MB08-C2-2]